MLVAVTMGRGGSRTNTLPRVVVGLGMASALLNLLTGSANPALGVALMAAVLVLIQGESAKEWFRVTDPGHTPVQGGHPGHLGEGDH